MEPIETGPYSLLPVSVEAITDHAETVSEFLDDYFGEHYAREHPALLGQLVEAVTIHSGSVILAQQVRSGLDGIAEAIRCHTLSSSN